jgi:hypothetical protein
MVVESVPKDCDIVAQQQPLTDGQSAITLSTHSNRHTVEFFDESAAEKYQQNRGLRRQSQRSCCATLFRSLASDKL